VENGHFLNLNKQRSIISQNKLNSLILKSIEQCFSTFLRHGLFSDQYKPPRTQDRLRLREWYEH